MESTILAANTLPHNTNVPSQALLEVIAMDGPGLVALIRAADLKVLFVNHQFHSYLGYTNADLEKETLLFTDLFVDNIQQRLLFQLNFVKDDVAARSRYVIYRLSGKDKKILPFYVYAAPVNNPEGEQYYYLTMHPDLSKWDMPFTSSNTRELFLEQFNSEDFGTFEWIIDVNKVFWSLGVYRIYEVERGQEMDIDFIAQFTHPDDRDRLKKLLDYAIENNQDLDVEYRIISAKNKVKIIHSLARVIRNSEGKRLKLAGSIRDVTEQRQIKADLENKVEELNHSNKELEEFAYVASHDMQEPLRKITTFSDRLSEKYKDVLTGDGLMYLSRMIASAENMRSLINDLLDFSRISKTAQNFEPVDLNRILRQVRTDLELTIEESGTIINSHELPATYAIPSQMKQLFLNILGNAIKFHKPGVSPVITIDAAPVTDAEKLRYDLDAGLPYFKIAITDNGIGFDEEYSARIFQVFQRLHGKSEYPGSGIGLAICKKIVEHHHGAIYASNVPGIGARFEFMLPKHM